MKNKYEVRCGNETYFSDYLSSAIEIYRLDCKAAKNPEMDQFGHTAYLIEHDKEKGEIILKSQPANS